MIKAYKPALDELSFRESLMADPETMSYNDAWGGTIPFPKEDRKDWYEYWMDAPESEMYYRYLYDDAAGCFVGEIAYHYDDEIGHAMADVIIYAPHRRRGYGGEALDLLCAAAKENGVAVLYDDLAIDNPAVRLFLRHGFTEESRTKETIRLRKTL